MSFNMDKAREVLIEHEGMTADSWDDLLDRVAECSTDDEARTQLVKTMEAQRRVGAAEAKPAKIATLDAHEAEALPAVDWYSAAEVPAILDAP